MKDVVLLICIMAVCCLYSIPVFAQSSASYDLSEHVFNNGGDPQDGTSPNSTNYEISFDAIGDSVAAPSISSTSYTIDSGFVICYPPPTEVLTLKFTTKTTLNWSPEPSTGTYKLYRGDVANLSSGYGACIEGGIINESTTDATIPSAGQSFFYLVTANNLLYEEGTMGYDSSSNERTNPGGPCP